jgi:hypothetical protein
MPFFGKAKIIRLDACYSRMNYAGPLGAPPRMGN